MDGIPWSGPVLISLATFAFCLIAVGLQSAFLSSTHRRFRQAMKRVVELEQRLSLAESRLRKLIQPPQRQVPTQGLSEGRILRKEWRSEVSGDIPGAARTSAETRRSPTLIAVPGLGPGKEMQKPDEAELSQRHAEVLSLSESGASADEIARQTGQPIGQVELILGLLRTLKRLPRPGSS